MCTFKFAFSALATANTCVTSVYREVPCGTSLLRRVRGIDLPTQKIDDVNQQCFVFGDT